MSSGGKYVRIDRLSGDLEVDEGDTDVIDSSAGKYVRIPHSRGSESEGDDNTDHYNAVVDPDQENKVLREEVAELKRTVAELTSGIKKRQDDNLRSDDIDESWSCPRNLPSSSQATRNITNIRWDQIKPFPKGLPANKMWQEWTKYIQNFEIAASLSNAYDPARRSQLLFLSMGDELQSIVRAARLRPNLNDEYCYTTFIKNIEGHLRSLTDTAAEHQAFTCMQQEKGESVVNFHARLMEKVRLCQYSSDDQERFVRAQLIKGMSNRELARASRTFGYETNFIVQSAMRDEAYQGDEIRRDNVQDPMINQVRGPTFKSRFNGKRRGEDGGNFGSRDKQQRFNRSFNDNLPTGRRQRCSRCNRWSHWNRPCPASKQKCNSCDVVGHFAAACRQKRVNAVQDAPVQQEALPETKMEEV